MNSLKIIYVTANLPYGTSEAFFVPEVTELLRLGHQVRVVPRSPGGPVPHGRDLLPVSLDESLYSPAVLEAAARMILKRPAAVARIFRDLARSRSWKVAAKNLAVVPKALWLADQATRWRADHIHCHWAGTTATMAMLASKVSGIPWSLTLHRWDIVENNLLVEKARSATFVRFISNDGLRMAKDLGVEQRDTLGVLRMGVAMPSVRRPAGTPHTPVVLCPARLVEVKGHKYLLEAWRKLKDRGVAGELWLAGDGDLRERLEALASQLEIQSSIRFLGDLPHDDLVHLYEAGRVTAVAMASIDLGGGNHEGLPVALIEAMSYGVPVVATDTGGIAELVRPETGLLVAPEDAEALAHKVGLLLKDPALAAKLGEAGRRFVSSAYDIARVAGELAGRFEVARRAMPAAPQYV